MKSKTVNIKDLGTDCWSAKRFTGGCYECDKVQTCKLKEGRLGHAKWCREQAVIKMREASQLQSYAHKLRKKAKGIRRELREEGLIKGGDDIDSRISKLNLKQKEKENGRVN